MHSQLQQRKERPLVRWSYACAVMFARRPRRSVLGITRTPHGKRWRQMGSWRVPPSRERFEMSQAGTKVQAPGQPENRGI